MPRSDLCGAGTVAPAWMKRWAGAVVLAAVASSAIAAGEGVGVTREQVRAAWREQLLGTVSTSGGAPRVTGSVATATDAAGGNDGVKNGQFGFHTNQDNKPWWHVDLGEATVLDRVVIYNRCTVSERARNIDVRISADGVTFKSFYLHDGKIFMGVTDKKPLVVDMKGAIARFVRVQVHERTWMHLDEIEVYGAQDPKKNIALGKPSDQSSTSSHSPGKNRRPARAKSPKPAAKVGAEAYAKSVAEVLQRGRLLADDLRAAGVDTTAFDRAAAEIETALKDLPPDSPELTTLASYLLARGAVRKLALANPLLDFEKLLVVRRSAKNIGLPANWQSNSSLKPTGFDNELAVLTDLPSGGKFATLFRPEGGRFVGDVDVHFDGDKMLFSMPGADNRWRVFELDADGKNLRQLKLIDQPDVGNYDACYLPDGNIIFNSTAPFIGVPCVRGGSHVTNLYLLETAGGGIRRLTFDQEHTWCPTVLNNGRVMYLRWEYSGLPHSNSRILFHMNPDGTGQLSLYGSNSYWPNSLFYARPIPGDPSKVAGIVTGHHGSKRVGELVIFDTAKARREADGVVQRFPERGRRVEPLVRDRLVDPSWPKFLHPYPLSDTYILTAAKLSARGQWGLYLVDAFDNMILLAEQEGQAILEPIPLRPTRRPPVLAGKVDTSRTDAVVYVADVYRGKGLAGIPRGTVKKLRLFTYHFSYHGIGGLYGVVGSDGPWDIKRVLGTVPVEPDGSAAFRVPANTPISIQPLDEKGQALQLMRSWLVGMPGEVVSCTGCHERENETPPVNGGTALARGPSDIEPWRGPVRGFSYPREVQPVVDKYCLGCHSPDAGGRFTPEKMPDLRGVPIEGWASAHKGNGKHDTGSFSVGYVELARYVRRAGIESNIHMLAPMEYHAGTTELVQMLRKGHHRVKLDDEAWDRLITWIDLNAPYHGTWSEAVGANRVGVQAKRRQDLLKMYAGVEVEEEAVLNAAATKIEPVLPEPDPKAARQAPECPDWPFDAEQARRRQLAAAKLAEPEGKVQRTIELADGITLELTLVPAGEFIMGEVGDVAAADEAPVRARIDRAFWMGRFEITNKQFALFDPMHDGEVESKHGYQFGIHGYPVNGPDQPVVRVSWRNATAFCQWLSRQTGESFALPTEAQWEYACRAGSAGPFHYGGFDADFSKHANLGDAKLSEFASDPYTVAVPMKNPNRFDDWLPKDARFNDGALVSVDVGGYLPNAWGLHDMHGNVAEWTRSAYRDEDRQGGAPAKDAPRVVRGGSWYDRPKRCRSAFRLAYRPYQPVYNVGFRVIVPARSGEVAAAE